MDQANDHDVSSTYLVKVPPPLKSLATAKIFDYDAGRTEKEEEKKVIEEEEDDAPTFGGIAPRK